jgi:hypothetical protein
LKTPVLIHDKEAVDNVFFTCCALHNQLHIWDGRDQWENGATWGAADGLFEEDAEANYGVPKIRDIRDPSRPLRDLEEGDDFSGIGVLHFSETQTPLLGPLPAQQPGIDYAELVSLQTENEGAGFSVLQGKLVANFDFKKKGGYVQWMRSTTQP